MFAGLRTFVAEIFQDIDGGYSAKRTAFFVLLLLFVAIFIIVLNRVVTSETLTFLNGALDKIVDLIKWIGGFIASEQITKFKPTNPNKPEAG